VAVASVISATNLDIRIAHCELVGFTDGVRESAQSWRDPLLDLKCRGLIQGRSRARRRREGYRPQRPRYGQQPAGFRRPGLERELNYVDDDEDYDSDGEFDMTFFESS